MARRLLVSLTLLVAAALTACGGSGGGGSSPAAARASHHPASTAAKAAPTGIPAPQIVHTGRSHRAVPILMYHVIGTPAPGTPYPGLWVAPSAFRAQVQALAAAGFAGVTLDRVLDAWNGRATLPAHPVVLSFDDGYLGQGKVAAPVLAARRWPGVINVVLHNLGVPGGIGAARLRAMIHAGWELDAHTLTHRDLTTLDAAQLRHELAGSRAALRRRFGVAVDAFCYPAGRFNATVQAAVRAAGYRAATTEIPGAAKPSGDRYALPRIRVDGGEGAAAVVAKVRAALGSGA
jgi:peptidoglycan/xylan/chitin deacetylase (PgdA/CDA1 family)